MALTSEKVRHLYRTLYIERPGFLNIDHPALFWLLVDSAILCGRDRTVKWLQAALFVTPDGKIGPKTLAAIKSIRPTQVFNQVLAARIKHHGRDITDHPKQAENAAGWANRVAEFVVGFVE